MANLERTLGPPFFREYLKTHPWLDFRLDLRAFSPRLLALIGEARSKCEHVAGVPLKPRLAEKLHTTYLVKGVMATTAIEGNPLTAKEVERELRGELELPPSREYQRIEVANMIACFNRIADDLSRGRAVAKISSELICQFNRQALAGLEIPDGGVAGEVPTYAVGVGSYRGAPRADCPFLLQRLCDWLNEEFRALDEHLGEVGVAVIKAVVAHLYLAWIHPFPDGNGRTARLLEFYILLHAGVPLPSAHLLSDHYNTTRMKYYHRLQEASLRRDVVGFLTYAVEGFVDELRQQIAAIKSQQQHTAWIDYLYEIFDAKSAAETRQRKLVVALTWNVKPVPRRQIRNFDGRVAELYYGKTEKTVTRDLNALLSKGLIEAGSQGFRATPERVLQFLPLARPPRH
jgi:Fic family protein